MSTLITWHPGLCSHGNGDHTAALKLSCVLLKLSCLGVQLSKTRIGEIEFGNQDRVYILICDLVSQILVKTGITGQPGPP